MLHQIGLIVLAVVALISGVIAPRPRPRTACRKLGETCNQYRRCCKDNLKCEKLPTSDLYECKEKTKLGDSCRITSHCVDILHSVCSKTNKCECRHNNVKVSDYACAPILNGYCWRNETCVTVNSRCIDHECRCRDGFIAEDNKCLPVVIGSKCSDDAACANVQFADCSNNVCVCSENAIEINKRLCSVRLGETCQGDKDCAVANSWCDDNKCQCRFQHFAYSDVECRLASIGMPCNVSIDCYTHFNDSFCIDDTCQCKRNYLLRNGNACSPVTTSYCSTTDECMDAESVCISSRCQCKPNYIKREFKCLPQQLTGRCNKNTDCSEIPFAVCSNERCDCPNGFFNDNGTACRKALGGNCTVTKDCTIKFSQCIEKKCQCNRGYIQYSEIQCSATELGTICFDNSTCNLIKNGRCFESQCSCKENHIEVNAVTCAPLLHAVCSDDLKCAPLNSLCIDHKCQCEVSYFPKSNYECVLMYLELECKDDKDCSKIRFAKCSPIRKCICHQNYARTGPTTCAPTLKGYCTSNGECVVVNGECFKNHCRCSPGYTQHSDDLCLPVFLDHKCDIDEDCDKISNAKCSNKRCQCKEGYTKFDRRVCLPLIGTACTEHKECAVYNSNCIENTCQCLETFVPQSQTECASTGIDNLCYSDDDCQTIHTHCSRFNYCICNENYISIENKTCVMMLGARCAKKFMPCLTLNADCVDNTCQCKQGYVRGPFNDCVLVKLGDACVRNGDCKNIPNAICVDNKCACKPDTFALNPTACTQFLNTNCSSSADCGIEASHCDLNKCQCRPDWVAMTDTLCAKRSSLYFCDGTLDCGEPWNSKCYQNRCVCNEHHMAVNDFTCLPTLGGSCWKDDQCITDNSLCIDYKCRCKPDFVSVAVNMCAPS